MATECTPTLFAFEAVERKAVVACFDGGTITSNGGALLLGQVDRGLGLVHRFAACFTDRRDPRFVEHRVATLAWISHTPITLRRAEAPASVILAVTKSDCDEIRNAFARGSRIASPPAAASRTASRRWRAAACEATSAAVFDSARDSG
jgi:hypothetical protein